MSPWPAALPALTPQTRRTVSSLPRAGVQGAHLQRQPQDSSGLGVWAGVCLLPGQQSL